MTSLFACDLDRTLIYTVRSAALGSGRDTAETNGLRCVEWVHGEPLSYVTADVPGLLRQLSDVCRFVPVTTRSRGQYRRVELFTGRHQPEWAVCANGGHLLHRGRPDTDWHRMMSERLAATSADPGEVARRLAGLGDWVTRSRVADGLFSYALVDVAASEDEPVAELAHWLQERGWVLSRQGRKIYAAPAGVDKWAAVAEVCRRTGATRVAAAGDSILDQVLLDRADFSIRPPHGELAATRHPVDLVVVPSGVAAGAAILRAALAWVDDYVREAELR
ncbi:MAG: HAD family hydrolase [Acidimicrobiales bacterium]